MNDLFDKLAPIAHRLHEAGEGPVPFNTVIERYIGPCEAVIGGRTVLMCGSNNYLGLSFHPDVLAAARGALDHDGAGTTGSRAANGTLAAHRRLENRFASLFEKRHAMLFTTGYQANVGIIAGLCGADDTVVLDADSHASIYDGARLSGARLFAFRHNSPRDLERKLSRLEHPRRCLVIVEGLYSIWGDVSPLTDIAQVCRAAGAYLMVDEAHSFGVYGNRGLGWAEAQGVLPAVDFVVGTFSKALAGVGGFCASDHEALALLHFTSRAYVFTASSSPATIAGVDAALTVQQRDPALRDRLWSNLRRARAGLKSLGFEIGPVESPIIPVVIGTPDRAIVAWRALLEAGVYVNLVLPPACRVDACLLRASFSAAHEPAHIDRTLAVFAEVGRELGIVKTRPGRPAAAGLIAELP